jgi:Flp pilus assembly protein TadB
LGRRLDVPENASPRRRLTAARVGFFLSGVYFLAGLALIAISIAWYANGTLVAFIALGVGFLLLGAVRFDVARRRRRLERPASIR